MQFRHEFTVPVDAAAAFAMLTDLELVAPCMPGVQLAGRDGRDYHGTLRLKAGHLRVGYQGTVTEVAVDPVARRVRLTAAGRETSGQGTAHATVEAEVSPDGVRSSAVSVVTDLEIQGRAAPFGDGVVGDVIGRALQQFARNLEAALATMRVSAAEPAATQAPPPAPAADTERGTAVDVWAVAAGPVAARVLSGVVGLLIGFLIGRLTQPRCGTAR